MDVPDDITGGLKSLSFSHFLTENEAKYEVLRYRIANITNSIGQKAAYLVSCMNKVRNESSELHSTSRNRNNIFHKSSKVRKATRIGIIGCGRVGKQLIKYLCKYSNVKPEDIVVSTRKPHHNEFQELGVSHSLNNRFIVRSCSVVFLLCLPSHLNDISLELQGMIPVECFLFSFLPSIPLFRLRKLLGHNNIAKMDVTWTSTDISVAQSEAELIPLSTDAQIVAVGEDNESDFSEEICQTEDKFFEVVLYATLNVFPNLDVNAKQIIEIMNKTFLNEYKQLIQWTSFLDNADSYTKDSHIPFFDLYHVGTNDTPLTKELKENQDLKTAICGVFDQFKLPENKLEYFF